MALYKRGKVWWFKFHLQGQLIRESAKTNSKTVARDAEHSRRRELEKAINRIAKPLRMPLFSVAGKEWLAGKIGKAASTMRNYQQYVKSLNEELGDRLVCDIGKDDIRALQRKRLAQGLGHRSVNYEIGVLRQILRAYKLWSGLADDVDWLRERENVGKAMSPEDEQKLIAACAKSRSLALLPLFVVSIDAGLRAHETKVLRRRDLRLVWCDGVIVEGEVVVPKSKTDAGTGREVPLTRRVCAVLTLWLSRFPDAGPESYIFPRHKVGFAGNKREPYPYEIDLARPIGEWKSAWYAALEAANIDFRWHDCRHTFVTRLAENPEISEETIKSLAGHVSKKMLERYSHIRRRARQAAIASLERRGRASAIVGDGAQNWAQSEERYSRLPN